MKWSKYIKPYLAFFILGPLCMIVEVVGEVIMPRLLAVVINGANKGTLTVPTSLGVMGLMILTALVMMGGGIGLRAAGVFPNQFVAFFYTGLGCALALAGILFIKNFISSRGG